MITFTNILLVGVALITFIFLMGLSASSLYVINKWQKYDKWNMGKGNFLSYFLDNIFGVSTPDQIANFIFTVWLLIVITSTITYYVTK